MKKAVSKKVINKKKVFVGMSGGVDSSVSAALLKEATPNNFEKLFGRPTPKGFRGYDVTGVFIKVWSPEWLPCDWKEERRDAMRVAAKLQIPFMTLDLEKEYKEEVVDYMIEGYKKGIVPNPDVMCNKIVKFGGFFKKAMEMGADFVATGHYARTQGKDLLAGKDENKDQSYFLWTLTQKELSKTLFPVGDIKKEEVRKLAEKFDLPTAKKKDSQGLCFLGKIDIKDFLKRYIKEKKGDVLNEAGEKIGEHDGAAFYTIGERHGFDISKKGTDDKPYFIVDKDMKKNILIVSHNKSEANSSRKEIVLQNVNWINEVPNATKKYSARIRYRGELKLCIIMNEVEPHSLKATVVFDEPQTSVASGQSLVVYDGDICLGGGTIV